MKRILSFVLSIIFVFSSVNLVFADNTDNSYEVERSLGMLKAIGQFLEYDMTTVEQEKEISRGEFAEGLASLLNLNATEGKLFYHDVSKEYFAYNGITALTEAGYMNGCGDNLFEPERIMTRNEAAIVLTSVLGYKIEAVAKGGTEAEYIRIANRIELFDGTVSNGSLTFGDMLVMFANSLTIPMLEATMYGATQTYAESNQTFLSVYYDCHYEYDQRVIYANNTGIYPDNHHEDRITIGNRNYIPLYKNMENYLGSYVNFIYKGNPDEEVCQIVWIEKSPYYDELILYEEEIEGFNGNDYTYRYYNKNGTRKQISLDKNISVIYNGCFENDVEKFLKLPCTEIRFIENKDGVYDVAIIYNYTNYIIDSINVTDEFFITKDVNEMFSIKEDEYENFLVLDEKQNVVGVDSLVSDATISVFKSFDGKYLKLIMSQKTVEGIIESIYTTSNSATKVKINGEEYELSSSVSPDGLQVGKNVFIYFDYNNRISYIKKDFAYAYMAYIIGVASEGDFSMQPKIKAFNQDGEMKIYETTEKFKVDGKQYSDPTSSEFDEIVNRIDCQLVILEFDGDGKIRSIDTAQSEGELEISAPFANCSYREVSPKFGRLSCVDNSTKFFSIPNDPKDAEEFEFQIKNKAELGDWRTFYAQTYQYTNETAYANVALIQGYEWNAARSNSLAFVYKESHQALKDDGTIATLILGMEGGTETAYFCEDGYAFPNLSIGDAVFLNRNQRGEICGMEPAFSKSSEGGETTTDLTANRRVVVGYVSEIKGNVISIGYTVPGDIDEKFDCAGTPMIVVDEELRNDKVKFGTVADITSFEVSTTEYSKIAIQTNQMSQKLIVVYK